MRNLKALAATILATTMLLSTVTSAQAAIIYEETDENGYTNVCTDNDLAYKEFPAWIWIDGYCYYYMTPGKFLTSTTTPDGYTVDEQGRWTENGVAVHNGLGNLRLGTETYLGKTNDEVWSLMKENLINSYKDAIVYNHAERGDYTYSYKEDCVEYRGGECLVKKGWNDPEVLFTAQISRIWSDEANQSVSALSKATYADKSIVKEKTLKALLGDNVGGELFHHIKAHADKTTEGYMPVFDTDGNLIKGDYRLDIDDYGNVTERFVENWRSVNYLRQKMTTGCGDGMDPENIDFSAWQNRTTDYGKRFTIENYSGFIRILVYK